MLMIKTKNQKKIYICKKKFYQNISGQFIYKK